MNARKKKKNYVYINIFERERVANRRDGAGKKSITSISDIRF